MSVLKMAVAVVVALLITFGNTVSTRFAGKVPETSDTDEISELTDIFEEGELSEEIIVVSSSKLTDLQKQVIICLQGLVAREKAAIFLNTGASGVEKALKQLEAQGFNTVYTDEDGAEWNFESTINHFSSYIADSGYVLYSNDSDGQSFNMATNLATVKGWLAVPAELKDSVEALGLEMFEDYSDDKCGLLDQIAFFSEYKDEFRKDCLIHQISGTQGLRDLAVAQKIFVYYTSESDFGGRCLRTYILNQFDDCTAVLGWGDNEIEYVKSITSMNGYVIPSDHSYNLSLLSCCDVQVGKVNDDVGAVSLNPDKHYVTLLYSDGDNVQWIQNGYSAYYEWQELGVNVPVSWSFPPLITEFSAIDTLNVLQTKSENDCFVSGPSGAGYTRILSMDKAGLDSYTSLTAGAMSEMGMTTVTLLEEMPESKRENRLFENKISYFARFDNIHGGLLQLDPDRYVSGNGCVYFVNDKPFISVRLSLWYPTGNPDDVTKEWLKEQAEIINSYDADINSINGYSLVNIHPWTMSPEDVAYFVSQLDKDVEIISADELISALAQNIPHENATPTQ